MKPNKIYRPRTRGELADALRMGISCEVTTSNREVTTVVLDGWLNMKGKYKVQLSKRNIGWDLYTPAESGM